MKQLRTEIITLCDYANIAQDGKLSINGIFDELYVQKFPGGFIDKFLVATLRGEPNKSYSLTLKLEKEGSKKNLLNPTFSNIKISPNGKHNWVVKLESVGFETEGNYRFIIYNGNEEVSSVSLQVKHIESRQEAAFKMPN